MKFKFNKFMKKINEVEKLRSKKDDIYYKTEENEITPQREYIKRYRENWRNSVRFKGKLK